MLMCYPQPLNTIATKRKGIVLIAALDFINHTVGAGNAYLAGVIRDTSESLITFTLKTGTWFDSSTGICFFNPITGCLWWRNQHTPL